jgi:hypothetical protein
MGRLVEMLRSDCENCRKVSIPLSISGKYVSGEPAAFQQCPHCDYIRPYGGLGPIGLKKRKRKPVSKRSGGRFSLFLREMAKK